MYPYIDLEELSSIHGLENTPNGQSNEHAGILLLYTSAKKWKYINTLIYICEYVHKYVHLKICICIKHPIVIATSTQVVVLVCAIYV